VDQGIGLVLGFHRPAPLLVFRGMGLGVLDHLLMSASDSRRKPDAICCSLLVALSLAVTLTMLLASMSSDRSAARRAARRNALQVEAAQRLVVRRHFAFALEHIDGDGALIVFGGREDVALLVGMVGCGRSGRVKTPPRVSMPNDGVTSSSSTSLTSPFSTPP
jgi:hypothetical protein